MTIFTLRPVAASDILSLTELYMEVYRETNSIEKWTLESTNRFIQYFYNQGQELFFVAESEGKLAGGIWGQVKPWWNGTKVYNLEVFVKKEFQRQGLSRLLLRRLFETAIEQHKAVTVEAITFNDREFPLNYYERIELKKDKKLVLLEGNIAEILEKL